MPTTHHHFALVQFDPWSPAILLVDIGTAFWLIAYLIAIVQGFRFKTYGLPMLPICLNFTWEILASTIWIAPVKMWHYGAITWMGMDVLIVYQLFAYGRAQQKIPEIKRWYHLILVCTLIACLAGQFTFAKYFKDRLGFEDAYLISIVMGVLFIFMFFVRREAGTYSYAIAWTKMIGTGLTSLSMAFVFPKFYPGHRTFAFMDLLYVLTFIFDALYVTILWQSRKQLDPEQRKAPIAHVLPLAAA